MILYNITFNIEHEVADQFKDYLNRYHFPVLENSPSVLEHKMFRLLNVDESEAITLTLQYFLQDMGTYNHHIAVIDVQLKRELFRLFGEKVLYFCSILEKV